MFSMFSIYLFVIASGSVSRSMINELIALTDSSSSSSSFELLPADVVVSGSNSKTTSGIVSHTDRDSYRRANSCPLILSVI